MTIVLSKLLANKTWLDKLESELSCDYIMRLQEYLDEEIRVGKTIYPDPKQIFYSLNQTDFHNVKAVILGQDPYHGPGQAHGLSFSVKKGVAIPPSLKNIFKELNSDLGIELPEDGDLTRWAKAGVLLLNTVLTVEKKKAGSHKNRGWEQLTDKIIKIISDELDGVVFILWGSSAQKKCFNIDKDKHEIIKAVHPSPLSSYRGFFGSKPFSKANSYLISRGKKPVDWRLSK